MAVQRGNEMFVREGISNAKLSIGKADKLGRFQESFDIVLTDLFWCSLAQIKSRK